MKQAELICDVLEALEEMSEYKSLYLAVLRHTGSREQALKAVRWIKAQEAEECSIAQSLYNR